MSAMQSPLEVSIIEDTRVAQRSIICNCKFYGAEMIHLREEYCISCTSLLDSENNAQLTIPMKKKITPILKKR